VLLRRSTQQQPLLSHDAVDPLGIHTPATLVDPFSVDRRACALMAVAREFGMTNRGAGLAAIEPESG